MGFSFLKRKRTREEDVYKYVIYIAKKEKWQKNNTKQQYIN